MCRCSFESREARHSGGWQPFELISEEVLGNCGSCTDHWKEEIVAKKPKKVYVKPEVRQIKLSLAELTLGTNCDIINDQVMNSFCPPNATVCNI